jgi:hypothetical protein
MARPTGFDLWPTPPEAAERRHGLRAATDCQSFVTQPALRTAELSVNLWGLRCRLQPVPAGNEKHADILLTLAVGSCSAVTDWHGLPVNSECLGERPEVCRVDISKFDISNPRHLTRQPKVRSGVRAVASDGAVRERWSWISQQSCERRRHNRRPRGSAGPHAWRRARHPGRWSFRTFSVPSLSG